MPLVDVHDVFCFTSGDVAVGNSFNFSDATLVDPVTIDTSFLYGQPQIFTSGPNQTDFNGSDATFLGGFNMEATLDDGTVTTIGGNYIETADGNTYVMFNDGAGDFNIVSGTVTSAGQPRENILTSGTEDNNQDIGTPPCFTPDSIIETQDGPKRICDLEIGDRILTKDAGHQPLRWVHGRALNAAWLAANPDLKPIVITKGALAAHTPDRDMMVSPGHLFLIIDPTTGEEVFVPARQLLNRDGVHRADVTQTVYVHLMFDTHQVVRVDGCWSESFQPSLGSVIGLRGDAQSELLRIFPELATSEGLESYAAARPTLYRKKAKNRITGLAGLPLQ